MDGDRAIGGASRPLIELVGIRKAYMVGQISAEVLRGVNLEVHRGDFLSIMGPSGCGKSTLMNILGLLDRPGDGSYRFDGVDTAGMSDRRCSDIRNASIGFVFQSFYLLPRLTAWENVGVPLVYRGLPPHRIRQRACEMLDTVGMADRANHRPNMLSGGQQQRVAIARALVAEPLVVLADEPTGALDAATAQEILEQLVELNARDGMTVIIITHDRQVAHQCTRRTRMVDGSLRESRAELARTASA